MWKVTPDAADSRDDSTEGNGCRSDISCGGGVSALCNGDWLYDWKCEAANGGREARLSVCGDCFGEGGICEVSEYAHAHGLLATYRSALLAVLLSG
jgi:hypothetical protein